MTTHTGLATALEDDFKAPPVTARPYVWWHWMGPNFSREGITKDLEAMKASGIGGATILNLASGVQNTAAPTENNPWPEQTFRSQAYWAAVRHAAAEADRLGLELGMHNTPGYSTTGGPWIDESQSMQQLFWSSQQVTGGTKMTMKLPVPRLRLPTMSFYRDIAVLAVPAARETIALAEVLDLTARQKTPGELSWDAPPGQWLVYRIGHGSTSRPPTPMPDDILGKALEADKMSLDATRHHWEQVINPVKEQLGPLFGKSFRHFLIDSYEAGQQNWTPTFREEFQRRKGYDPLPWLATMGPLVRNERNGKRQRIVGSLEQTERFEWDYQDVIATLFYENGWQPAAEQVRAAGCSLQWEPYGGPFDTVAGAALADLPMGEFWNRNRGSISPAIAGAGRAAGRRVIGAEALTGMPNNSRWTETPAMLKIGADGAFCSGVNRLILHHWVHQPFDDRYKPGMSMGWWGTHFGRHQTWAELGKEFYRYLGRCQALLQRGETPVDFVSVASVAHRNDDVIPTRAFLRDVRVDAGRIVLPSGRRYAFIHIPHDGRLLPEMLRQIKTLLAAGGTVVTARPDRSPSLAGYPACDIEVRQLADEIWNQPRTAGRLYGDVNAALKALGITPVAIATPGGGNIQIAHRHDAEANWFFVANLGNQRTDFNISFRVTGRSPELWNAETGTIELAPSWREKEDRTEVDVTLGAVKSVFVVFRQNPTTARQPRFRPLSSIAITGPWAVELVPAVGTSRTIFLDRLQSLSEHPDPDVKYFSGTATYRATFMIDTVPPRLELDLGDVRDLARVAVNGRDLGVLWHPPFVRDIAAALQPGDNRLELAVANTWHNRLVGDEQFPADFEWAKPPGPGPNDAGIDPGRALKAYPAWFLKGQPRPEPGRKAFTLWYYHRQDTPLIPAGLLGPVTIQAAEILK